MSINLTIPMRTNEVELKPRISVIGVGGAGGNAVNNMIQMGLEGVEFVVANSDAQALSHSTSESRIQMGTEVTRGLGAGSNPDIGRAAAEESLEEILAHLREANMVFVTAGLGGGTGTGAAPVIAKAAREYGILTVGVVTKPFQFEGANRMKIAEAGLEELQQYVDTLLIIPNQNLFRVANEKTTFADAFKMADDVLYSGVRGVTDLMVMPGLINLDFADIKSVMSEMGKAMMGTGEAEGERRAIEAAEAAIANPLLDDISMSGAQGVLINITAGSDITLFEVDEAANRIRDEVADDANIIFGSTFEEGFEGKVRVSVVATGIESNATAQPRPVVRQVTAAPEKPLTVPSEVEEAPAARLPEVAPAALFTAPPANPEIPTLPEKPAMESAPVAEEPFEASPPTADDAGEADETDEIESVVAAEDVFIPAPPVEVSAGADTGQVADPFAAADMVNAATEPAESTGVRKVGLNLFERVTGLTRSDRKAERKERVLPPPPISTSPPERTEEPVITAVSEPVASPPAESPVDMSSEVSAELSAESAQTASPAAPEPAVEAPQSAVAEEVAESAIETVEIDESEAQNMLGGLDPDDPLAGSQDEDDLLDIPAFLRRQAN